MRTSIAIYQDINRIKKQQADIPPNAKDREARLYECQGRLNQLDSELAGALAEEDSIRSGSSSSYRAVGGALTRDSITVQAFGPRASFEGAQSGFRAAITIPTGPRQVDPDIPGFADAPRGFADTLTAAPTTGAVTYLRRGARTNAAAQWAAGSNKAESSYAWAEVTAPLAWIAHHTPISKTEASDWSQLDSIVRGEMLVGLSQAKSREALVGANAAGITGVLNTVGIQTYTPVAGDNVYDSIRKMVTRVYLTSGFMPTHVAVAPQVAENMDLLREGTNTGQYLRINVGGRVWDLEIVIDGGLTTVTVAGVTPSRVTTTRYGVVVYSSVGATWFTKEQDNVEIGLVDNQFIRNAYTLLAEGRNALAVRYPDAFNHCVNGIPATTVTD